MQSTIEIVIANATTGSSVYTPNAGGINLPTNSATIADLNNIMRQNETVSSSVDEKNNGEPIFGTHIKEAVAIVKDWTTRRTK